MERELLAPLRGINIILNNKEMERERELLSPVSYWTKAILTKKIDWVKQGTSDVRVLLNCTMHTQTIAAEKLCSPMFLVELKQYWLKKLIKIKRDTSGIDVLLNCTSTNQS